MVWRCMHTARMRTMGNTNRRTLAAGPGAPTARQTALATRFTFILNEVELSTIVMLWWPTHDCRTFWSKLRACTVV